MPKLISINVGLPRDVSWQGRTVFTGVWKSSVQGRRMVRRLNIDGDGQGDLGGHGGEQRAVFVYQLGSYSYWENELKRNDFTWGQFGENFTVEGLGDDEVCIGDRYRIGSALFEVTQPRVTCYRVGIRMEEPQMAALLTSSNRTGFYFRVLEEGLVAAGDEIVKIGEADERMTVAEINALLYSPHHPHDRLEKALRIAALSSGWRSSFDALLKEQAGGDRTGNAGLAPAAAAHPAAPGFRSLKVVAIDQESADVLSLTMQSPDGQPLGTALPGQYVVLRLPRSTGTAPLFRSYSLSGPLSTEQYRISVKCETNGAAGTYLRDHVRVGDALDVSSPRGSFILESGERPVVLLSAGIGATPVLAMLNSLAAVRSTRPVWWLHAASDGGHHPFASEVRRLVASLPNGRILVCYSRPGPDDRMGENYDSSGHITQSFLETAGIPRDADVYLCGPARFMDDMREALQALGMDSRRIFAEIFNGSESMEPGVTAAPKRAPHLPADDANTGPLVSFARSGIAVYWKAAYQSILELAEACDVPVRWSCRSGVCHNCESGLVSGEVVYGPEPLDAPAAGNLLICCSRPTADVVIDL